MDPQAPPKAESEAQLDVLRRLLLAPEQQHIERLDRRLEDRELRAEDISEVLPAAIRRSLAESPRLSQALAPVTDAGLREAVRRNPKLIVDVVYPVLGPVIRKAVVSAIRGTIESLNRVIEHSFTWRGLRWRMEAMRTGESVAEVALRHSLVYRVEQVFLIHRETGLPLESAALLEEARDQELVSGMLTAIQDFVRDSFSATRDHELDRLEVGDYQVWIERGPRAVLAAVILGSAPRSLRSKLADVLDRIHFELGDRLQGFDGNAGPFAIVHPDLEGCLDEELAVKKQGASPALLAITAVLLLALGGWAYWSHQQRTQWDGFLAALESEPGLIVIEKGDRDGRRYASILEDPLARPAADILAASEAADQDILLETRPYLSLDAPFVAARDRQALDELETRIEAIAIRFGNNVATIEGGQEGPLFRLASALEAMERRAVESGIDWSAAVIGSSDAPGPARINERLRQERADNVRDRLIALGAPADRLTAATDEQGARVARVEVSLEPAE